MVILGVGGTSTLALTFELCVSEALQRALEHLRLQNIVDLHKYSGCISLLVKGYLFKES